MKGDDMEETKPAHASTCVCNECTWKGVSDLVLMRPRYEDCAHCEGDGWMRNKRGTLDACPICDGLGEVMR